MRRLARTMVFNTFHYLIFFPVVCLLYFVARQRRTQTAILLIASYYFYMAWKPMYALLLVTTTSIDYLCALRIDASSNPSQRKAWLALSITSNLATLFTFKYFDFAADAVASIA